MMYIPSTPSGVVNPRFWQAATPLDILVNPHIGASMLRRFDHQCRTQGQATIVFLGGSITDGAHSSDAEATSWRARTSAWLQRRHPECELRCINAAVGGTGSDFALGRLAQDVLAHRPDLVFIEFAVNDHGLPLQRVGCCYEGLVRGLRTGLPDADLIALHTLARDFVVSYALDEAPAVVRSHQAICDHYAVPTINVGRALADRIVDQRCHWDDFFSDEVHPMDAGHASYAGSLAAAIAGADAETLGREGHSVPPPLNPGLWSNGAITPAWGLPCGAEWQRARRTLWNVDMRLIGTDQLGACLEIPFSGTVIALLCMRHAASGAIDWQIDDGEPQRYELWDRYCPLAGPRPSYAVLAEDLEAGPHLLRIIVREPGQHGSDGSQVDVFGIFTADRVAIDTGEATCRPGA